MKWPKSVVSWLYRLVDLFWTLTPLLVLGALSILLLSSAFSSQIRGALRRQQSSTSLTWCLLMALLLGQVLAAAVERRETGASPLLEVSFVGPLLGKVAGNQRLDLMLLMMSVVVITRAAVVRSLRERGHSGPAASLLLGFVVLTTLVTAFNAEGLAAQDWVPFLAVATSGVAILLSAGSLTTWLLDRALVIVAVVILVLSYWVLAVGQAWATTSVWTGGFIEGPRYQGIFPQPNVAGAVFACLAAYATCAGSWSKVGRFLVATSALYLVMLTGSRGAILILIGAGLYAAWLHRQRPLARAALASLLALSALVPFTRISDYQSINGRDVTWRAAEALIVSGPVLGQGIFPRVGATEGRTAVYAHNQVLQTLVETGILGLLILVVAVWLVGRRLASSDTSLPFAAIFFGLVATFPIENPVRMFELPFAFLLSLFLLSVTAVESPRGTVDQSESHRRSSSSRYDHPRDFSDLGMEADRR